MTESPAPATVPEKPRELFVRFEVHGTPVTQGSMNSPRAGVVLHDHAKRKKLTAWRNQIRFAGAMAMRDRGGPWRGPIAAKMAFTFPRPKSRPRDFYHTAKQDLDKLERAVLDALTGIVWVDDGQVARVEKAKYLQDDEENPEPGLIFQAEVRSNVR